MGLGTSLTYTNIFFHIERKRYNYYLFDVNATRRKILFFKAECPNLTGNKSEFNRTLGKTEKLFIINFKMLLKFFFLFNSIFSYHSEFLDKGLCKSDPKFCAWVLDILRTNKKWALEQEVLNKTDYWKMVR